MEAAISKDRDTHVYCVYGEALPRRRPWHMSIGYACKLVLQAQGKYHIPVPGLSWPSDGFSFQLD